MKNFKTIKSQFIDWFFLLNKKIYILNLMKRLISYNHVYLKLWKGKIFYKILLTFYINFAYNNIVSLKV